MPWWWTSSPTITLLPGASMPPMLHHHHVSPSGRCCYLMPPTFKKKNRSCISLSLWHSLFKNPLLPFLFFGQGLSKYINKLKNKETRRNTFFISKCSGSVKVFFFYVILLKPLLSPSCCSLRGYFPHGQRSFQQPWLSWAISAQHRMCLDDSQLPWQPPPAVLHVNALPGLLFSPLTDLKEGCSGFIRKCNYQMIKLKHVFRVTWRDNSGG